MSEIPEGGLCLSMFLVISKIGNADFVLMGHLNKSAPWDHIGTLDPERAERHSKGWMFPSSHPILGEAPLEAAKRILLEQLGLSNRSVTGPLVFFEVSGSKNRWDLEYVFQGERADSPTHQAWSELRFIDLTRTRREEIARSHEYILINVKKMEANMKLNDWSQVSVIEKRELENTEFVLGLLFHDNSSHRLE